MNTKSKKTKKQLSKGPKAYQNLLALGKDRLALVEAMLIKGDTPLQVTRVIQGEWGQCLESDETALRQMLYRYKDEKLADQIVINESAAQRLGTMAYLKDVREKFQGVHDLVDLALVQKMRLNKMLLREEQMPVIMDQVSREMQNMASLVERTVRLQMDLGIIQPLGNGQHADDEELRKAYAQSVQLSADLKKLTSRALQVIEGDYEVSHGGDDQEGIDVGFAGGLPPSGEGEDNLQAGAGDT